MGKNVLRSLLTTAGKRMALELEEELITHRGERGRGREASVRRFLGRHLPRRFEVSDGFVFDYEGNQSDQLDIVIANPLVAPQFESQGGVRLFPVESVLGVGQVKTKVTSEREFFDALDNLASVGALDRSAGGRARASDTGEPIDHRVNHTDRVFTFLFIVGRSLDGDRARELLLDYAQGTQSHQWPNLILAREKFLLTFHCDDGPCPNTSHARGITLLRGTPPQNLVQFYLFLARALEGTSVGAVPYSAYLSNVTPPGDVTYSVWNEPGEPPPYIASQIWLSDSQHEQRRAQRTDRRSTKKRRSTTRRA